MDENLVIRRITLYFTILCAVFVAMSPQFMGFILPLMFLIPIFMAISGLKHRKKSGFLIAMGIVPLALSVSIIWVKYSLNVFSNMSLELTKMSTEYKFSNDMAQFLVTFGFIMGIVMLVLCVIVFTKLLRYKTIFR